MSYPKGTICIGQNFCVHVHRNGQECEIMTFNPPGRYQLKNGEIVDGPGYEVCWRGETDWHWVEHHNLKRKDLYNEELRGSLNNAEFKKDRAKVSAVISSALKAIGAGERA